MAALGSGLLQVAVAYSILEFQQQPDNCPMSSYIWDVSNPNTPDFELTPQSQLTSINFNLKDTSLVGAGQYNGQFAYFDMRKGSTPVEASPIEHSHRSANMIRQLKLHACMHPQTSVPACTGLQHADDNLNEVPVHSGGCRCI